MSKKWTKAQYGRERYLATEFIKSKSEQMNESKLRGMIRGIIKEQMNEDFKNNEWEVYVADEKGKEKIVKVAKSKRAGVILYNKLINTDKYHEVGMRVIKEEKVNEAPKPIHHSDMRMLYVPKKDIKNAIKLLKLNIKQGQVEVEKKPSDKVKGFYRFTTTRKMFDDVVTHLAMKKIGVKTLAQGKM